MWKTRTISITDHKCSYRNVFAINCIKKIVVLLKKTQPFIDIQVPRSRQQISLSITNSSLCWSRSFFNMRIKRIQEMNEMNEIYLNATCFCSTFLFCFYFLHRFAISPHYPAKIDCSYISKVSLKPFNYVFLIIVKLRSN